jgi:hypothetical protein
MTTDTNEYKYRTIPILNVIMPQMYPFSDNCQRQEGKRPVCPALTVPEKRSNPDMTQPIPIDDTLAMGALPYALAGHLLSVENESLSGWMLSRYYQAFSELRSMIPASPEPISTPYGLF